jgi:hypothetical protein
MDQDLIDLVSAWTGAELPPARSDELLARLRQDEAFQQAFLEQISMLGMLKVLQSAEPRWLRLQHELGWKPIEPITENEFEERFAQRLKGVVPYRFAVLKRYNRAVAACAAVIAVALVAFWWRREAAIAPRQVGVPVVEVARGPGIALVSQLDSVQWELAGMPNPGEGTILSPGRVHIFSGRVVVSFFSGVMLTLEGPADVDLLSFNRVFCRFGKLRAQVPPGAEGFVIRSPGSAVVDMGTELGVNVDASGKTRVMVFEGKAEAALLDASGSPMRTQIVGQSHAFEIDPSTNQIVEATASPEGFTSPPGGEVAPLALDAAYPQAVLRSRPRSYWRFESLVDGTLTNEIDGGPPLHSHGGISLSGDAPGRRCVVFGSDSPDQFLSLDSVWELAPLPGHAVEFWFLAENIRHASLVGLYPLEELLPTKAPNPYVHVFLVEQTSLYRQSLNKPASVRFLHRWPIDVAVGDNLFSDGFYRPGRWHHVVAQKNGERMELYFDGEPCQSTRLEIGRPTIRCHLVVGRRSANPDESYDQRKFVGRLDELAIYDRPLAAAEAREHHKLGIAKAGPR